MSNFSDACCDRLKHTHSHMVPPKHFTKGSTSMEPSPSYKLIPWEQCQDIENAGVCADQRMAQPCGKGGSLQRPCSTALSSDREQDNSVVVFTLTHHSTCQIVEESVVTHIP